jgi:hypothetical protein
VKGHRLIVGKDGRPRCICGSWAVRAKGKPMTAAEVSDSYFLHIASGCRRQ